MNSDSTHPNDDRPEDTDERRGDASLDELIRHALNDEAASAGDQLRLARLESFWRSRLARQRAWRRVGWGLSAAAAALLFAVLQQGGPVEEGGIARVDEKEVQEIDPAAAEPTESTKPMPEPPRRGEVPFANAPPSDGRAPTEYERWMFAMQTRTRVVSATPTLPEVINRVLAGAPVDRLRKFDRDEVEASLVGHVRDEVTRGPALAALKAVVGYDGWPRLVRGSDDALTHEVLVRHLLQEKSEPALVAFLRLVHDDATRGDTLAAAARLAELPIDELVALLDHEDETIRLATSLALGRVNRCEMTDALITRVSERPSRSKEAWFALFGCRCEAAADFLNVASRSPKLLGQLNNARVQWGRVFP